MLYIVCRANALLQAQILVILMSHKNTQWRCERGSMQFAGKSLHIDSITQLETPFATGIIARSELCKRSFIRFSAH